MQKAYNLVVYLNIGCHKSQSYSCIENLQLKAELYIFLRFDTVDLALGNQILFKNLN